MVKNLTAVRETWIQSVGWEDPLEEDMATHSSILAWRIPWMEEPGRLQSIWSQRVGHNLSDLHACTLINTDGWLQFDEFFLFPFESVLHF